MRLWYASNNTTFEEYLYHDDEGEWKWQRSWENFSGAAGVGCYTWARNHAYIYAAFVNLQNQVEIYYRTKTDAHLATGWEKCKHACCLSFSLLTYGLLTRPQRKQSSQTST